MADVDLAVLAALPAWAFGFVLVVARAGAAVLAMPGLGEVEIPVPIRLAIALALAVTLLPVLQPLLPPPPPDAVHLVAVVAAETVTGLFIGLLARVVVLALSMAGQVVAFMLGLSNVLQFEAGMGGQSTAVARLFGLAAVVLLFAADLHALPLRALAGSYAVIGPGAVLPAGAGAEQIVAAVAAAFGFALQLAGPFVLAATVWQCALGLLARLVPSLQVYFVALPAQLLGGFLLLAIAVGIMLAVWLDAMQDQLARLPGL